MADTGYDAVGITAPDKVVIHAAGVLGGKVELAILNAQCGGRVVVPEQAVSLDGLDYVAVVIGIALNHAAVGSALGHLTVLLYSYSVQGLIGIQVKALVNGYVGILGAGHGHVAVTVTVLGQQDLSLAVHECYIVSRYLNRQGRTLINLGSVLIG